MDEAAAGRTRLLECAADAFAREGFEAASLDRIASAAELPIEQALLLFPTKHACALALFQGVVADAQSAVADLEPGTVGQRFAALVEAKLDRLDARRPVLRSLLAVGLDAKGPAGVLSAGTAAIRARMSGAVLAAVVGASDAPPNPVELATLLYGLHLTLILLWTQDDDGKMARATVALVRDLLGGMGPLLALPPLADATARLGAIFGDRLAPVVPEDVDRRARFILGRVMSRRRLLGSEPDAEPTEVELAPHLPLVRAALAAERPLELLLPAFPAKSPSPQKTLGKLPDYAESAALRSLQELCAELSEVHPAGVRLVLCSDGLVFADVVGVSDEDVAAYGARIDELLVDLPLLRRFDLAHAFGPTSPDDARRRLLAGWGESEEMLRGLVASSRALGAQLDGLHRFLFEDAVALTPGTSRTKLRNEARPRAFEVLRRSRAWGNLLASLFPHALRLTIHPQPRVSEKIGVHLLGTADAWLTPWHGVALIERDRVRLVKRSEAEGLGAKPVDLGGPLARFVL